MAKKIDYGKLPKVFKEKWLAALRSGKYKQGTSFLTRPRNLDGGNARKVEDYNFCCLGVAGHVAGCSIASMKFKGAFNQDEKIKYQSKVPKILQYKSGQKTNQLADKLIEMNDTKKQSFKQIANWIERNL